jgi:hypothetical protein
MKKDNYRPIILGKPLPAIKASASSREFERVKPIIPPVDPGAALKTFSKTAAAMNVPVDFTDIFDPTPSGPVFVAGFTACGKTGSALYLDIWDCDHFDYVTDMARNLADCRVWFSAGGYADWGSGQTKTGVVNCHFSAPVSRRYRCDATLQSYGGGAVVECSMDGSSFGQLSVNGTITQPHSRDLSAGNHSFRIRQVSGSFFFVSLVVYAI